MKQKFCPNCGNRHIVIDGRKLNGVTVLFCGYCTSWFTDEKSMPVLFQADGGDDVPDEPHGGAAAPPCDDDHGFSGNPDLPAVQGF